MGALPRPDVPPGPRRDLIEALHRLHHRAGWPSLRVLGRQVGCSPTTVSAVFSAPRLPTWGTLELVVEAMGGDVEEFHEMWLTAGAPNRAPGKDTEIAGRSAELAAIRRHLTGPGGLLLLAGEAGIGKTRLSTTAERLATFGTVVVRANCLPLSSEVPLLPVAELLRTVYQHDAGQSLKEALADCARYVPRAIARLVPEIADSPDSLRDADHGWERQWLFAALGATFAALGSQGRWALVVEDLHWADSATPDLVEHLVTPTAGPGIPIVGTYRTEDPDTPTQTTDWFGRMRRLPHVDVHTLRPLSTDETAEQMRLLGHSGDPEVVAQIQRRAEGNPLFAEQLAAHTSPDQVLPTVLGDLLDRRLDGLDAGSWPLARTLAVADRPVDPGLLGGVTGLGPDLLTAALRDLEARRLLREQPAAGTVELRHPLLAEAMRRRLVAGEAANEHRRLAAYLAATPDPVAAEVAEHWQRTVDRAHELEWRIRAARTAQARFSLTHEAQQWHRALELWPDDVETAGTPPLRKHDVFLAAMDALMHSDATGAAAVAEEAMSSLADPDSLGAADIYQRAGESQGMLGDPAAGLALIDKAIEIYETHPASLELARALRRRELLEQALGRLPEATATAARAVEVNASINDPVEYQWMLAVLALHTAQQGDIDLALERIREAAAIDLAGAAPIGLITIAIGHTYILNEAGAPADEVAEAGRPALEAAAAWGIETIFVSMVRNNVAEALRRSGQVQRAAEIIDPVTTGREPTVDNYFEHAERAILDLLQGRVEDAITRLEIVWTMPNPHIWNLMALAEAFAYAELWSGRPQQALDRLRAMLDESFGTDAGSDTAPLLVLAAHAAADVAATPHPGSASRHELLDEIVALPRRAPSDPFAPHPLYRNREALLATWKAELARLAGEPALERWVASAQAWDRLARPHDAAYSRWCAATEARRSNQAAAADRLLRRATADAREHVPLLQAITTP